jgi:hypothetical protein
MKRQVSIMIALVASLGFLGASAAAQTSNGLQLIANIPFEFTVGNKILPAGEYSVSCVNPASDLKVLALRSREGRTIAMVRTTSVIGKVREDARLVFNRYGNEYFFSQAWLPADPNGMQAPKAKTEKAIAKRLAGMKPEIEVVSLSR